MQSPTTRIEDSLNREIIFFSLSIVMGFGFMLHHLSSKNNKLPEIKIGHKKRVQYPVKYRNIKSPLQKNKHKKNHRKMPHEPQIIGNHGVGKKSHEDI